MEKIRERPIRITTVMELSGYSRSHIYKLVYRGKIPCRKPNNGRLYFYESEILDFLSRGKRDADYEVSKKADAKLNGEEK